MKIKRVYIKVLLFFIGILFITEILILGLFVGTAGRTFKNMFHERTTAKLAVFKHIVSEKIGQSPDVHISERDDVKQFFGYFADLFNLSIWVTDDNHRVLIRTSETDVLPDPGRYKKHKQISPEIDIYFKTRRHFDFYAVIPVDLGNEKKGFINIHYKEQKHDKPEGAFLIGLLIIGTAIALMIIPLSRLITRRVNQLNDSALRLAQGDLTFRSRVKGNDEIANLGRSFNLMADKIEQMVMNEKEMTANISHELRSPLARIRISKEIINERIQNGRPASVPEYLKAIDDDIQILDRLIDDILKMSKIDLKDPDQPMAQVDIAGICRELAAKFRPAMDAKQLSIELDLPTVLPVLAHGERMFMVFSNVLDNAVKHSPQSALVRMNIRDEPEGRQVISISNPLEPTQSLDLEKLFDPFYRGTRVPVAGSGLGLYIARKIIRQYQGEIQVRREEHEIVFDIILNTEPRGSE